MWQVKTYTKLYNLKMFTIIKVNHKKNIEHVLIIMTYFLLFLLSFDSLSLNQNRLSSLLKEHMVKPKCYQIKQKFMQPLIVR